MIVSWLVGLQLSAGAIPADACTSSWRMESLPPSVAAIENAHAWTAGGRVVMTGLVNGAVVVMDATGKSLGFPKTVHAGTPIDPRVVMVSGTTHVLWGEGQPEVHTVWISSRSGSRRWSSPRRLLRDSTIGWRRINSGSSPLAAGSREVRLAVPVARNPVDAYIALLRLNQAGASFDSIPNRGFVAYADAAWGNEDVIAFVGGAPVDETDYNSVMTYRRDSAGWGGPVLVSRSGTRMAHYARIARTRDGTLHLVWTQHVGGKDETLRHVSSTDGGFRWSAYQDTEGDGAAPYELWTFGNGVAVLTEEWDSHGPARVSVVCWDGAWREPKAILPGAAVNGVRMVGGSGGTLAIGRRRTSVAPLAYENVLIRVP